MKNIQYSTNLIDQNYHFMGCMYNILHVDVDMHLK